jgi:hypothetical protein
MAPRGVYRTKAPQGGAEYAFVDYGAGSTLGEMTRAFYERRGYNPVFESLPTKETYEASPAGK